MKKFRKILGEMFGTFCWKCSKIIGVEETYGCNTRVWWLVVQKGDLDITVTATKTLDEHIVYFKNWRGKCLFKKIWIKTYFQSWWWVAPQKLNKVQPDNILRNFENAEIKILIMEVNNGVFAGVFTCRRVACEDDAGWAAYRRLHVTGEYNRQQVGISSQTQNMLHTAQFTYSEFTRTRPLKS